VGKEILYTNKIKIGYFMRSVLKPVTGVVVIQRPVTDYSYVLG